MRLWLVFWSIPLSLFGQPTEKQAYKAILQIMQYDLGLSALPPPVLVRLIDHDSILTLTFNLNKKAPLTLNDSMVFSLEGLREVFIAEQVQHYLNNGAILYHDTIISLNTTQNTIHPLTVEQLYQHRSGLPRVLALEPKLINFSSNDFWSRLALQKLNQPGHWNYSTLDYLVLQEYINLKTNTTWDENFDSPYLLTNKKLNSCSSYQWIPGLSDSTSRIDTHSLLSTVHLLSGFLVDQIKTPPLTSPSSRVSVKGLDFIHGWYLHQLRGKRHAFTHAGHSKHHKVFLGFAPHTKTGVIVLTTDPLSTKDLGWLILRWLNQQWKRKK